MGEIISGGEGSGYADAGKKPGIEDFASERAVAPLVRQVIFKT